MIDVINNTNKIKKLNFFYYLPELNANGRTLKNWKIFNIYSYYK